MSEEEVNAGLREEAAERRRKALTKVETLDLSHTTWPELAEPADRQRDHLRRTPGPSPLPLPARHGAAQRARRAPRCRPEPPRPRQRRRRAVSAATRALLAPGQKLVTRWPSYPLYPLMARRAHGQAVPVDGGIDELIEAARRGPRDTRGRACQPQRPDRRADPPRRGRSACSPGCPTASSCCSTRPLSTSPTPSRPTHRSRCSSSTRGCSCSAASPRRGASRAYASAT